MLGSGPFSNTSGSGYYSAKDYREILEYARDKHVTVIPEFDMPGHSRAAIRSVHARGQQAHRKQKNAERFGIIDEMSNVKYMSGQHFTQNAINPCMGTFL